MANMLAHIPTTAAGCTAPRGISFRSRIQPLPSKLVNAGWGSRSARARGSRVLRVACDEKAASWVDAWKKRDAERKTTEAQVDATEKPRNPIFAKSFERAQAFHYVYVCDTGVNESDMEVMYWKDVFSSVDVDLKVISPMVPGPYTISNAIDLLAAELEGETRQVRLMGHQVGALVAALYASKNAELINGLFLIEPAFGFLEVAEGLFGGAKVMAQWKETGTLEIEGGSLSYELITDAEKHAPYPFVKPPAYVVHGNADEALPFDNSLAWVRGASTEMRGGRVGYSDELAGERRLLEIATGHGLVGCTSDVQRRLLTYWELVADIVLPDVNVEGDNYGKPEDYSRPHSYNFDKYAEFLGKFEAERDRREDIFNRTQDAKSKEEGDSESE